MSSDGYGFSYASPGMIGTSSELLDPSWTSKSSFTCAKADGTEEATAGVLS